MKNKFIYIMDSLGYKSHTQHDLTPYPAIDPGPRDLWYPVAATRSMGRAQMDMARPQVLHGADLRAAFCTALMLFWM